MQCLLFGADAMRPLAECYIQEQTRVAPLPCLASCQALCQESPQQLLEAGRRTR